ncbi:Hypothetical predicted protein [Octopus vulgaris]|uniref:Uncharacterized protein n=1 Tax=Octopus vulgaris TaxID=6645 RepID=A0AA36B4Y2_OCTVU|nr:Hypothetical predicted protein [Octopus vulgaris]
MPTVTRATPVSSSASEEETESEYQESEKSDEESTKIKRKYSKTGTATKLVISSKLSTPKSSNSLSTIISRWNQYRDSFPIWYLQIDSQRSC